MGGGSKHLSGTFTATSYQTNVGFSDERTQLAYVIGGSCTVPEISSFVSLSGSQHSWFSLLPDGTSETDAAIYRFSCRVDGKSCYENAYGIVRPSFFFTRVVTFQSIYKEVCRYAYLTKGNGKDLASVIDVAEIQYPILTFPNWLDLVLSSVNNGSDVYDIFYSNTLYDLGTTNNMDLQESVFGNYVPLSSGKTYTIEVDYTLDAIISPTGVRTF